MKNDNTGLTQKEENFCLCFLDVGNATDAYLEAFKPKNCKRKTITEKASRLINTSKIQARIKELQKAASDERIYSLKDLKLFWTRTITDARVHYDFKLKASALLAKNLLFEKETEQSAPPVWSEAATFTDFCKQCGYFAPYPQQIEMVRFAFSDGVKLLLGARKYGKTDYVAICGVAHYLLKNPQASGLYISKEQGRGKDVIAELVRCLDVQGAQFSIKQASRFKLAGHTCKEPSFAALPIRSSSFRGRHPDFVICDDIVTPTDDSEAERERVKKLYEELLKLSPNIVIMGQPVNAEDLYADLRAQAEIKKMELPYGSIPELDADLKAQRAAGVSEANIQANYFLKISPEKSSPFANLQVVNFFPSVSSAAFMDPAKEGADYTAFVCGARNFDDFVFIGFCWRRPWNDCLDEVDAIIRAYNVEAWAMETNGLGNYPVIKLQESGYAVNGWVNTKNKHARIMNAGVHRDNLKLSNYLPAAIDTPLMREANQEFVKMVKRYKYGVKHDDGPDAAASLLMYLGVIE